MPDCTVQQVLTKAQSALGDPFAEITQELIDDFGTTYLDLIQQLMKIQGQEINREVYKTLPANTSALFPDSLGVTDFSEPAQIWERGNVQSAPIASVTDGTPITVTLPAPLPFGATSQVELSGIQNVPTWVNRDWWITVTSPTTFTLNGSIKAFANASPGTGTVNWSQDRFIPVIERDISPQAGNQVANSTLGSYVWENNILYFPAANNTRQVWINYYASPTPPAAGNIGLCEGRELNFLAYGTAARFAPKRGIAQGPYVTLAAYGPSSEPDGTGGMLRQLLIPIWQQSQVRPKRSGTFRPRRVPFPFIT